MKNIKNDKNLTKDKEMDKKLIKEMIKMMNENHLSELEVEQEGVKIRLKKFSPALDKEPVLEYSSKKDSDFEQDRDTSQEKSRVEDSAKTVELKAPMVGTFYSAASPDSPPFVQVGDEVSVGQVVCIIEAMKLMNEIKSEVQGKVVRISVENAEPVEFGQPLFSIQPT